MTNRDYILNNMDDEQLAKYFIKYNPYYGTVEILLKEFKYKDYNNIAFALSTLKNWLGEQHKLE